jgi:hypothetical protein
VRRCSSGCSAGVWSAEVMGSVCAGVPLRGLDPAFVKLVGFLTGRVLMCAFSGLRYRFLYHALSIDRYSTQTPRHLVMIITSLTYNLVEASHI